VESPQGDPQPQRPREPRPRAYGTRQGASAGVVRSSTVGGVEGRRTIQITGQAAPPRRRSTTQTAIVARPDRVAMWAFALALFLVLMALATAHA
jgi:hypothetical protein